MDFTLDTKSAASYGNASQFISDSGKYVGVLIRAAHAVSKSGTQGLDLAIRTDAGGTIDYVTLWHTKSDGSHLSGFDAINALMTCLRIRGAKAGQHTAEKWDKDAKEYRKVQLEGYQEFCGKKIGVVLQATIEHDQDGKDRNGKQIIGWFEPATELTASEILAKSSKPEQLAKQIEYLAKVPVKDLRKGKSSAPKQQSSAPAGGFSDFEDDIPFNHGD